MLRTVVLGTLGGLILVCVTALAQEGQRFPGPGSGIIKIEGAVDVRNTPTVRAAQGGDWKMAISNAPDVRVANRPTVMVAAPDFIRSGGRYQVTWATGDSETVQVTQAAAGGWVRVEATRGPRWINLAAARSVEEASAR